MDNISDLITKLRKGEKVTCLECGEGVYVTTEGYTKTSHGFWCDKCGAEIHITPSDVMVE